MATDLFRRLRHAAVLATVALLAVAAIVTGSAETAPARATVTGTMQLAGHGFGHGRGLGQWGSYGYATTYGWGYAAIVGHYYGGTTLSSQADTPITVRLTAQDGRDLVATSGASFHAGGFALLAGTAVRINKQADGFHLYTSSGCGQPEVWSTLITDPRVLPDAEPTGAGSMLSVCGVSGTKQYRGELSLALDPATGAQRTVNRVRMEDYLRGVVPRESPASWGDAAGGRGTEALKAQAVAARSYAYGENRTAYAQTCDTTACQVYGGAGTNLAVIEDPRSDAAVAATAGQVLRNSSGGIVRAEFSSSTGGYTAGGQFPAVPDDGDAASPYRDWSASVSTASVAAAFGVGTLVDFAVTGRNGLGADGGRVTSVLITGTTRTVTVTGDDVRIALGLKSNWFRLAAPLQQQPVVYTGSGNANGASATALPLGSAGDVPLSCDWNGDGVDTPAVFRAGQWFLTNTPGSSTVGATFAFGQAGDLPVCGDWDGNGTQTPGVYRKGVFYLRNSNSSGIADGAFAFGAPGDTPLAGRWAGGRFDTIGVWRGGVFYLAYNNLRPVADVVVAYGTSTDIPTTGDWNGDGVSTVGVYRGGSFYLRNSNTPGGADAVVTFGAGGDRPLPGRWSLGMPTTVGVARYY